MKAIIALFFCSLMVSCKGQSKDSIEYSFPKSLDSAIQRGLSFHKGKATLSFEISEKEDGYMINIRDYSLFSSTKVNKVTSSCRFTKYNSIKYPIWFTYDDLFGKLNQSSETTKGVFVTKDVLGGGYTIVFNREGKVLKEYKQQ